MKKKFHSEEQIQEIVTDIIPAKAAIFAVLINQRLREAPAADVVEVRHGRWKLHEDGTGTCQECGCRQKHVWDLDGWQNYCGHCGADMRNGGGRTILQSM